MQFYTKIQKYTVNKFSNMLKYAKQKSIHHETTIFQIQIFLNEVYKNLHLNIGFTY